MRRIFGFTVIVALLVFMTDLGGELTTNAVAKFWGLTSEDLKKSSVIMGEKFTCDELITDEDGECDWQTQLAFVRWGDNLNDYVKSERLGSFGNNIKSLDNPNGEVTFREVASIGLYACRHMATNVSEESFVDWAQDRHPDQDRGVFVPFWFAAQTYLCADTAGDDGYRSALMWID